MSAAPNDPAANPASLPPLDGPLRAIGTIALSTAMFMNVLDMTIANVAIPAIAGDLGASPSQGTWVVTSYGVANAISVILGGWLARRFGQVRLIVSAILLFAFSSLLCALAPTLQLLILFRVIQGLTAGPIIVLTQPLLLQSYPREKIGIALSAYIMTTLVAPILGPIVGGALTDGLSWHWIFYINIPIGLLAAFLVWKIYRHRESPSRKMPIDVVGLVLLVTCIGCMQLMIEKGRELDWFDSRIIVALGLMALVCGAFFAVWNAGARHPIVDFSFLRQRNFVLGSIIMSTGFGLFMGTNVIMSIWLQQNLGFTATWAGITMIPASIVALVLTPFAGRFLQGVDLRWPAITAVFALMIAFYIRSHLTSGADILTIALYQSAIGFGMALFFVPMLTMSLQDAPPEKMADAAGLLAFTRYVGGSSGTSLVITLWERRASEHSFQLYENINSANPVYQEWLARLGGIGLEPLPALKFVQQRIFIEANTLGANDVYLVCSVLFGSMAGLILLSRARRRTGSVQVALE